MSEKNKHYDLMMLNEMENEEPGALAHIVKIFLETTPQVLSDVNNHFNNQDYTGLGNSAHKIKSSIDLLMIEPLSPLIRKIEYNAKNMENLEEIPGMIKILNDIMEEVFDDLKKEIR